jgi:hypothetical protein
MAQTPDKEQKQQTKKLEALLEEMKDDPNAYKKHLEVTKKDGNVNVNHKSSGVAVNMIRKENEVRTYNEFTFSRSQRRGAKKVVKVRG